MFRIIRGFHLTIVAFCAAVVFGASSPSLAYEQQSALRIAGERPTIAPMLARVTPAVVNISVISEVPATSNPLCNDPFFRRFFELPETPQQRMSAGSGVIVDAARGHVLTNHHVIANAREISVTLKDGRRLRAELIGSDQATDGDGARGEAPPLRGGVFGDVGDRPAELAAESEALDDAQAHEQQRRGDPDGGVARQQAAAMIAASGP
jgi:S1-C subfamily serine protease